MLAAGSYVCRCFASGIRVRQYSQYQAWSGCMILGPGWETLRAMFQCVGCQWETPLYPQWGCSSARGEEFGVSPHPNPQYG